jgi:hypothetical protein
VYIPANYGSKHWFLIHINTVCCKCITVYDLLGERNQTISEQTVKKLFPLLESEHIASKIFTFDKNEN